MLQQPAAPTTLNCVFQLFTMLGIPTWGTFLKALPLSCENSTLQIFTAELLSTFLLRISLLSSMTSSCSAFLSRKCQENIQWWKCCCISFVFFQTCFLLNRLLTALIVTGCLMFLFRDTACTKK